MIKGGKKQQKLGRNKEGTQSFPVEENRVGWSSTQKRGGGRIEPVIGKKKTKKIRRKRKKSEENQREKKGEKYDVATQPGPKQNGALKKKKN